MRKSLMLIPTILLVAACNDVTGVEEPIRDPGLQVNADERCDPPRFEAYGKCHDRRGPKPE